MAGQPGALHLGIVIFSVGKSPDQEVDIHVTGNTVLNVTEPAINFGFIVGRIVVERNTITPVLSWAPAPIRTPSAFSAQVVI
jgi:hypothetical protein